LWYWKSISILHYQYEKPWEKYHPKAAQLQPLIDLCHSFHDGGDVPEVTALDNPEGAA
ncbi:glycosyl transferase, partial [Rhizobium ruizarguesonis]